VPGRRCEAVICDLLSALLDSWTLWKRVAGGEEEGRRWRLAFLERAAMGGVYTPYLELGAEAASDAGLAPELAGELSRRCGELEPWPEVPAVLRALEIPVAAGAVNAGMTAVWHNRAGLAADEDVPADAVLETLDSLWRYL
jgi:2-haloacid dehalogenase